MANPLWAYPEVLEGRIAPSFGQAGSSGPGAYGYAYPSYYYGYSSDKVFCLGRDVIPFTEARLQVGQTASVQQTVNVLAINKFWLFMWHMRVPEIPDPYDAIVGGPAHFVCGAGATAAAVAGGSGQRGLTHIGDGLSGVILTDTGGLGGGLGFNLASRELWCSISGATDATNNDPGPGSFHRLVCVPAEAGSPGTMAVIENQNRIGLPLPDRGTMYQRLNEAAVTIRVLGYKWTARAWIDQGSGWEERVALIEAEERNLVRGSMALHVSQFSGPLTVKFDLTLELEG